MDKNLLLDFVGFSENAFDDVDAFSWYHWPDDRPMYGIPPCWEFDILV